MGKSSIVREMVDLDVCLNKNPKNAELIANPAYQAALSHTVVKGVGISTVLGLPLGYLAAHYALKKYPNSGIAKINSFKLVPIVSAFLGSVVAANLASQFVSDSSIVEARHILEDPRYAEALAFCGYRSDASYKKQ